MQINLFFFIKKLLIFTIPEAIYSTLWKTGAVFHSRIPKRGLIIAITAVFDFL